MNFLSNILGRTGRALLDQCFRIVADPDSLLHAPLTFAINAINTAGAAHPADADRSSSALTSAQQPISCEDSAEEEELPELELIPGTHLIVRLPFLLQSVALQPRLDRAYSIYKEISQHQIPEEIRGLDKTVENLKPIEKFLIARDKLMVWRSVAIQSGGYDGSPEFAELHSLDDYQAKAAEFGDWLDQHPQAIGITELLMFSHHLSSIPPEIGKLMQLQRLLLGSNRIQKIEGLETLTQLRNLNLCHNQIQKVEGLEPLTQLTHLYLDDNQIQKLEGLEHLTQLRWMGLRNNKIQRREGVEHLPELTLRLDGNPIDS